MGGKQVINVADWASKGNVMHEIMHALGFNHEHSRIDRDEFVSVQYECISSNMMVNYSIEGSPLGNYDHDSIMHYAIDGKILKANSQLSKRMGQRERFSDGDLKAIKYLYSAPCCTYDVFGEEYFAQSYYECITCWGSESAYGVCEHCKHDWHSGHEVKKHDVSELVKNKTSFVCDCGRNRHISNVCTRISTKDKRVRQMFYICYDCFEVEEYQRTNAAIPVVCKACLERCHVGHQHRELGVGAGFCDCGKPYCKNICKATRPSRV